MGLRKQYKTILRYTELKNLLYSLSPPTNYPIESFSFENCSQRNLGTEVMYSFGPREERKSVNLWLQTLTLLYSSETKNCWIWYLLNALLILIELLYQEWRQEMTPNEFQAHVNVTILLHCHWAQHANHYEILVCKNSTILPNRRVKKGQANMILRMATCNYYIFQNASTYNGTNMGNFPFWFYAIKMGISE